MQLCNFQIWSFPILGLFGVRNQQTGLLSRNDRNKNDVELTHCPFSPKGAPQTTILQNTTSARVGYRTVKQPTQISKFGIPAIRHSGLFPIKLPIVKHVSRLRFTGAYNHLMSG